MTSTTLEEQILKTDTLGRVKTPPERREALLDEFEKSGMSGTKFAEFIGVKYQTWASWVQKRRRERAARIGDASSQLRWVEAVLEGDRALARNVGLSVHLPGGARMEVFDRGQARLAAELLRALSKETAC